MREATKSIYAINRFMMAGSGLLLSFCISLVLNIFNNGLLTCINLLRLSTRYDLFVLTIIKPIFKLTRYRSHGQS